MLETNSLDKYPCVTFDFPWWDREEKLNSPLIWANETSTSGGYSEHIFKYAAKQLFDVEVHELEYKNLRYMFH